VLKLVEERAREADLCELALGSVGDVQAGEGQLAVDEHIVPHVDSPRQAERADVDGAAVAPEVGGDPEVPPFAKCHQGLREVRLSPALELIDQLVKRAQL